MATDSKSPAPEKRKIKLPWLIAAGLFLLVFFIGLYIQQPKVSGNVPPGRSDAGQVTYTIPPPEPPQYGYFIVTCKLSADGKKIFTGTDVPPGDNVAVHPTSDVSYEVRHSGRPGVITVLSGGRPGTMKEVSDTNMQDMTFWLLEGQGVQEVPFVYCRYQTDQPPKGWYGHAVKTLRNRKS